MVSFYLIFPLLVVLAIPLLVVFMRRGKCESPHYVVELERNMDHKVWLSLLDDFTKFMKESGYKLEDFGADKMDWNIYRELSEQGKLTFFEGFVISHEEEEKPKWVRRRLIRKFFESRNVKIKNVLLD